MVEVHSAYGFCRADPQPTSARLYQSASKRTSQVNILTPNCNGVFFQPIRLATYMSVGGERIQYSVWFNSLATARGSRVQREGDVEEARGLASQSKMPQQD